MTNKTWLVAALLVVSGFARAESVSIVQITDMQGQTGYEVMNREDFTKLLKEIKEEAAAYGPAAAEAKKEWEANKDNKLPFQGNRVKPRSAKKMGADFTDREKADKKRSLIEDRESTKQIEEIAAKEKKLKGAKEEDLAKEEAKAKAFADAVSMISKKMADKLGRPIPDFGLPLGGDAKKEEGKKEEKKVEKKDEKKEEKKAGH